MAVTEPLPPQQPEANAPSHMPGAARPPAHHPQQPWPAQPPWPARPWPAQPAGPAARPPQPPTNWKLIGFIVGGLSLAMAAAMGLALLGNHGGGGGTTKDYEVRLVSCNGSDGSQYDIVGAQAEIEVVNKSGRAHSYTVTVAYLDATGSTQYGTGTALVNDLEPGQAGRATSTSWQGGNANITKCRIIRATRSIF
jgi:hypothetical protein